ASAGARTPWGRASRSRRAACRRRARSCGSAPPRPGTGALVSSARRARPVRRYAAADHYPIADGEVLLEQTDVGARVQTITPIVLRPGNTIDTAWRLGPKGQAIVNRLCPTDLRGNHLGDHVSQGD